MFIEHRVVIARAVLLAMLQGMRLAYAEETSAEVSQPTPLQNFSGGSALDVEALDAYRGGTEVVNDMKLNGVVSDNQAYNLNTGNNTITGGALAGASGMPMLIQNSGNNVLIQNATIVNVQMQP